VKPLPATISDAELIALIDQWAMLLDREEYESAFAFTDHIPEMHWSPGLLRDVIQGYGAADANQRVTADGVPTDIVQRKDVTRWPTNAHCCFGEIWYDLNINGKASDLTATFVLKWSDGRVTIQLNDIHVM
jgi:hypothetical protein